MFLRDHIVKKPKKEYTYVELVENVWGDNGHEQRKLLSLGNKDKWPPDRIAQFRRELARFEAKLRGEDYHPLKGSDVWEYGECMALDALWRRLHIDKDLASCFKPFKMEFDAVNAIKVMVFNRLIDPHSKLGLCDWTPRYYFPKLGPPSFDVHHYYRALDYLMKVKEKLETKTRGRIETLFSNQATLVFYDLTSTYFHGSMEKSDLARFGKSKDGRPGCKQIMLGLLVDPDGMPITHHVFSGNTRDNTTVKEVVADLESRFDIRHCIFVGDCGTLDSKSILGLNSENTERRYDYITSLRLRRNGEGESLVDQLPRREDFDKPKDKESSEEWIHVFPPTTDEECRPIRYIGTYHPKSAKAAAKAREERIQKWCAQLEYLGRPAKERKRKDAPKKIRETIKNFLSRKKATRFFKWEFQRYRLKYELVQSALDYEEARDGLQIIKTDSETLSDRDVVRGYRTLWRVERAFREVKDNIEIQPNHHQTDIRIAGHVFCCVLAYLLENVMDRLLDDAGSELSARKALERLRSVHAFRMPIMEQEIIYVTPPDNENRKLLRALGIKKIPVSP